ncbi:hypothetical protein GCM10007301_40010 [Azorhizobium oxalatiphilum]|uniref:Lipoprotein n=1 Tax=Azorhizobium oxalatiphilum TaxID=980631 RepID=A0A917FG55_9HYPH|nr:hypothetical protein [Azorhizobium oxalatiphilum]GGF76014.1 hypothetical protein GCM10007301_40010 [Azorhizobium oxalatiphilum]
MAGLRKPSAMVRLIRLAPMALLLAGCTTTASQDPTAMIPANIQATVMAEDHLQQARAEANAGDPNARSASVQEILARARASEGTSSGEGGAGAPAGAGGGTSVSGGRTASASAATQPAAQPRRANSGREFDLMFEGSDDQLTAKEQAQFAKSWAAGKVPAKAQVMITAGPASTTSAFDQAVVANRRLRNVRSLLPADVEAKQLYDPEMPPDMVRIVVGAAN